MKNTIEIKDGKVIKTFATHMDYVRESKIYEKIKGYELAPEMTSNWEGSIEHEYVDGENFAKAIQDAMGNPQLLYDYCLLFCKWYKKFRDVVNLSIGDSDFSDFILAGEKLYCIDFEDFKPGLVEKDIANLASTMTFAESTYSVFGMENAKIFVKTAFENLDLSSEKLYTALKDALEASCKKRNIQSVNSVNEYFATFVCTTFVHVNPTEDIIADMLAVLPKSAQMWTLFAEDISDEAEKNMRYIMGSVKDGYNAIYLTEGGAAKEFPLLIRTYGSSLILDDAHTNGISLLDTIKEKFNSTGLALENME